MVMYAKIRRMYYREHLSMNEIQRRTSLSRNTIKKWLRASGDSAVKYQRAKKSGKLTPFEPRLLLALEGDACRPKKDRRTAKMLFKEILNEGYTGGYTIVSDFIRNWRNQDGKGKSAYVPLRFALGEAFQFDWSEEWLVIGGIHRKVLAAHTKLCASRAFMLSGYPSQGHEMLFDAHTRGFTALGGIARRGIYDNMKTAVDKVTKGNGRVVNTRFFAMTAHYLFEPDFCNVASGWEKGIVEKNVQDVRRLIWAEAKQQQFSTFEDLNNWLEARCRALWSEIQHPDYAGITLADALEQEQMHLMPMPAPFDGYIEVLARVSSTCLVTLQRNRYSVPCYLANQMVAVHLYSNRVEIVHDNAVVVSHIRLLDCDQVSYNWQHYIPIIEKKPGALRNGAPFAELPAPLLQFQTALRRREHQQADRTMAKVLSLVPTHGLEAVLVAVELALESGVLSAEHVANVLARLKQAELPALVETTLKLNEEPRADTARYDRLSVQEVPHV
ncbi:IS21 family transposase [Nitrosomonas ureae]|uniref:IS21 family transposase n=1 Tax=Nitrosomonas ureae TaxID=44577 RepID=UPI0019103F68|nr:IS21 family transposase [Nitrosomonas ureae]